MIDPYELLGLPVSADDGAIRTRYLQLIREYPPEVFPERSAAIRTAYEEIRNLDARAQHALFSATRLDILDSVIDHARAQLPQRRITVGDLFRIAGDRGS